jgi:hypothetical protein
LPSWVSEPAQKVLSRLSEGTTKQAKEYQKIMLRLAEIDTRLCEEFGVDLKNIEQSATIMNEVFTFQWMEFEDRRQYIMQNKFVLPPGFMFFPQHCTKMKEVGENIKKNERSFAKKEIALALYASTRVKLYNQMTNLQKIQPVDICEYYKSVRVLQEERVHLLQVRRELILEAYRGGHPVCGTPPPASTGAAAGGSLVTSGAAAGGTLASTGAAAGGSLVTSGAAAGGTSASTGAAAGGSLVTSGAAAGGRLAAARAAARAAGRAGPGARLTSIEEETGEGSAESEVEEHLGRELFSGESGTRSPPVTREDLLELLTATQNLQGMTELIAEESEKAREGEIRAQQEREEKEKAEAEARRLQDADKQAERDMADAERERELRKEQERLAQLEKTAARDAALREEELRREQEVLDNRRKEEEAKANAKRKQQAMEERKRTLSLLIDGEFWHAVRLDLLSAD